MFCQFYAMTPKEVRELTAVEYAAFSDYMIKAKQAQAG